MHISLLLCALLRSSQEKASQESVCSSKQVDGINGDVAADEIMRDIERRLSRDAALCRQILETYKGVAAS